MKCSESEQQTIQTMCSACKEQSAKQFQTAVLDLRQRLVSALSDVEFQRRIIRVLVQKLRPQP